MQKFNLFTRSALASMAVAVGLGAAAADDPKPGEEEDPEAGPGPDEGAEQVDEPADAAAEAAAAAPAAPAATDVVPVTDAVAVAAEQFNAGRKAERDRTAAVLGSPEGKANTAQAGWMLSSAPDASADAIVAQLKTMPGAAAPAAIPDTGVDLGNAGAAGAVATGAADAVDVWAEVQGTSAKDAPVVSSDAGRATIAALQAGGRTVNTGGAAVTTPAVQPTGN